MHKEDNKVLKNNPGEKYIKGPFVIYADMESLLKKYTLVIIILKTHQRLK